MPLKGTDYVFSTPPNWLPGPLQRVAADLTYNEAHAMLLGLVGLFAGVGWVAGHTSIVATFTLVTFSIAFGVDKRVLHRLGKPGVRAANRAMRNRHTRRILGLNPWYYSTVYIVTAVIGAGVSTAF